VGWDCAGCRVRERKPIGGLRSRYAFSLWIGNHFIAADHGARSRADVLELAMRRLEAL